ncbi:MAG TPA: GNAT family N-acetyltransferase [Burkholderiales bacterium]|nr:GNAT family N-acetyltransferase [Burkholderiales bacterium]
MQVRPAQPDDIAAVHAIYAHHVLQGLASFEEEPPTAAEVRRRYDEVVARKLPYLVADFGGTVAGYGYCAPYRTRSAYRYALEDSIYVRPDAQGRGVGSALLAALIRQCEALGYRQLIAVIGDSAHTASIGLHEAQGFLRVGTLRSVGFKLGRWVDSVIMQRPLGRGDATKPI